MPAVAVIHGVLALFTFTKCIGHVDGKSTGWLVEVNNIFYLARKGDHIKSITAGHGNLLY